MKSGRMTWAGHVAHKRDMTNAYRILVGETEGNRSLGRQRRRGKIILEWIVGK
jgi:hypothetical protein